MEEEYETKKNIILNELTDESVEELYFNYCFYNKVDKSYINDYFYSRRDYILEIFSKFFSDIYCFTDYSYLNKLLNEVLRKQNEKKIQGDKITENINNLNKYIENIEGDIVEMGVEIHFIKDKVISTSEELTKKIEEHNVTKKLEEQEIKIYERLQEKLKKKEKIIEKLTTKIFEHQDLYEKMIEKKLERQDKKNTILILILCIIIMVNTF